MATSDSLKRGLFGDWKRFISSPWNASTNASLVGQLQTGDVVLSVSLEFTDHRRILKKEPVPCVGSHDHFVCAGPLGSCPLNRDF